MDVNAAPGDTYGIGDGEPVTLEVVERNADVRESITTLACLSNAVNDPIGVGCLGLPIDAGIWRTTWPSMLTVNVCASMSATPTVPLRLEGRLAPPAVTMMFE